MADLVPTLPSPMNGFTPRAKYLLIDENSYSDAQLASLKNLVAAVFRIEKPESPETIVDLIGLLADWLQDRPDLAHMMNRWINAHLQRQSGLRAVVGTAHNLSELKIMLHDRLEQWAQNYKAEGEMLGLEKGIEKGIEKGFHDGLVNAVSHQVQLRFGAVPAAVLEQLAQASESQLHAYLAGILSASSLEALFGPTQGMR